MTFNPRKLPEIPEEDGLPVIDAGLYAKRKYLRLWNYAAMFSTAAKKWDSLVYLDLFAGPGWARLEGRVVPGSPLLALDVPDPFSHYVFCDKDPSHLNALEQRVGRLGIEEPSVQFIEGDANTQIDTVLAALPRYSSNHTVLTFCFVDPYASTFHFKSIKRLSTRFMDFLILLPTGYDLRRNRDTYLEDGNTRIAKWLGVEDWRDEWQESRETLVAYLVRRFREQMQGLGYERTLSKDIVPVLLPRKNVLMYHLAFFSRNSLGLKLWRGADKSSRLQGKLDL